MKAGIWIVVLVLLLVLLVPKAEAGVLQTGTVELAAGGCYRLSFELDCGDTDFQLYIDASDEYDDGNNKDGFWFAFDDQGQVQEEEEPCRLGQVRPSLSHYRPLHTYRAVLPPISLTVTTPSLIFYNANPSTSLLLDYRVAARCYPHRKSAPIMTSDILPLLLLPSVLLSAAEPDIFTCHRDYLSPGDDDLLFSTPLFLRHVS